MIRSLPSTWDHLCINLTHNDNIKTFDDVTRHVEIEEDRLLVDKPSRQVYMIESKRKKPLSSKHKKMEG